MKPLVTVGICVRNGDGMLQNAVKSVINQDYPANVCNLFLLTTAAKTGRPKSLPITFPSLVPEQKPSKPRGKGWATQET